MITYTRSARLCRPTVLFGWLFVLAVDAFASRNGPVLSRYLPFLVILVRLRDIQFNNVHRTSAARLSLTVSLIGFVCLFVLIVSLQTKKPWRSGCLCCSSKATSTPSTLRDLWAASVAATATSSSSSSDLLRRRSDLRPSRAGGGRAGDAAAEHNQLEEEEEEEEELPFNPCPSSQHCSQFLSWTETQQNHHDERELAVDNVSWSESL